MKQYMKYRCFHWTPDVSDPSLATPIPAAASQWQPVAQPSVVSTLSLGAQGSLASFVLRDLSREIGCDAMTIYMTFHVERVKHHGTNKANTLNSSQQLRNIYPILSLISCILTYVHTQIMFLPGASYAKQAKHSESAHKGLVRSVLPALSAVPEP